MDFDKKKKDEMKRKRNKQTTQKLKHCAEEAATVELHS